MKIKISKIKKGEENMIKLTYVVPKMAPTNTNTLLDIPGWG